LPLQEKGKLAGGILADTDISYLPDAAAVRALQEG
jgi:hypothetical protein